jgi:hypothetical protein
MLGRFEEAKLREKLDYEDGDNSCSNGGLTGLHGKGYDF